MKQILIIYVTFPNSKEADKCTEYLLSKNLVACANSNNIKSTYPWDGNIESSTEIAVSYKTLIHRKSFVQRAIKAIHSYKVPCILAKKVEANLSYYNWIKSLVM